MVEKISFHHLGPDDLELLLCVDPGLFDNPVDPAQAAAFLVDPLHELVLAFEGGAAVGMVSGTVLLHPDKKPAFFVNELGTRDGHTRRGIATELMRRIIEIARARGCHGVWLGTEEDSASALAFYRTLNADEVAGRYFGWDGALDDR